MLLLGGGGDDDDDGGTVYRGRKQETDSPHHSGTVQFRSGGEGGTRVRRSSVTVKLNRVDRGGDGSAAVASPLLLRLFVAE